MLLNATPKCFCASASGLVGLSILSRALPCVVTFCEQVSTNTRAHPSTNIRTHVRARAGGRRRQTPTVLKTVARQSVDREEVHQKRNVGHGDVRHLVVLRPDATQIPAQRHCVGCPLKIPVLVSATCEDAQDALCIAATRQDAVRSCAQHVRTRHFLLRPQRQTCGDVNLSWWVRVS